MKTTANLGLINSPFVMCVDDGGDTVVAGGGADTVAAGEGQDTVAGGNADDTVAGGNADDTVAGGNADDTVAGGNAEDTVAGGNADDKIEYSFTPPEGVELDPKALEAAQPVFKELGLNNDQAQRVVDLYAKDILPVVVPQVQAQVLADFGLVGFHQWADQVREDPRFGGAAGKPISPEAVTALQADVARFRDQFGTPELTTLLETTTLGNHPEVVAAFAKAGKALADDTFHRSGTGTQENVPLAQSLYGDAFAPKG